MREKLNSPRQLGVSVESLEAERIMKFKEGITQSHNDTTTTVIDCDDESPELHNVFESIRKLQEEIKLESPQTLSGSKAKAVEMDQLDKKDSVVGKTGSNKHMQSRHDKLGRKRKRRNSMHLEFLQSEGSKKAKKAKTSKRTLYGSDSAVAPACESEYSQKLLDVLERIHERRNEMKSLSSGQEESNKAETAVKRTQPDIDSAITATCGDALEHGFYSGELLQRHNLLERKRRSELTSLYGRLQENIPKIAALKAPKIMVLKHAVEYIHTLKQKEPLLLAEINEQKRLNATLINKIAFILQTEGTDK